jgi:hypothetical protein
MPTYYLFMFSLLPISCLFSPFCSVFLRFPSFLPAFIPSLLSPSVVPPVRVLFPFVLLFYGSFFASFTNIATVLIALMNGKLAHEVTLLTFMRWVPGSILGGDMTVLIGVCGVFPTPSRRCWYKTLN